MDHSMQFLWLGFALKVTLIGIVLSGGERCQGQTLIDPTKPLPPSMSFEQQTLVIEAIDKGLESLAKLQQDDGGFKTAEKGKCGITGLSVMAFLARGHQPGVGPYGKAIDAAIDFILSQQRASGIFNSTPVGDISQAGDGGDADSRTESTYNHAISMLMLGEVYGQTSGQRSTRVRLAIEKGLKFTVRLWNCRTKKDSEKGGWRYVRPHLTDGHNSDLSVTAWHMTSLRSLKNAGFDVPKTVVDKVAKYVLSLQSENPGQFCYAQGRRPSNTMTAAGTLCLCLAGKYDEPCLIESAKLLSSLSPKKILKSNWGQRNWPFYKSYYIAQASAQLGGQMWIDCNRNLSVLLLSMQEADGSWKPNGAASAFGPSYSTAMALLTLGTQLQLLPIYQN
jgi:prenyltransferase beta subunit